MEDDPREVRWAETHVKQLEQEMDVAHKAVTRVDTDLRTLHKLFTEYKKGADKEIVDLINRVSKLEHSGPVADGLAQVKNVVSLVEDDLGGTDRAVATLNDRVSQLESRLNAYGVPEVRGEYTDMALESPPRRAFNFDNIQISGEDQFSPPVGGRKYHLDLDDELDGIPDVHGNPARGVDRQHENWEKARVTALQLAESRVRKYLWRYTLSATFTQGVIRALRGEL